MFLTLLGPQTVSGVVTTLNDVTTRSGGQIPLLLTSGSYANASGTVTAGSGNISGTLAATLAAVTVSSNGAVTVSGSSSSTLGALAGSATGTVTSGPTGALNGILADIIATATGTAPDGQQASGGYGWQNVAAIDRKRRRRRRPELPEEPAIEPAEIPVVAEKADIEYVRTLVAYWTGEADKSTLTRSARRALDNALQAETVFAMQVFERELQAQMRADEEEAAAILMVLLND